jgi:hypothetical protein
MNNNIAPQVSRDDELLKLPTRDQVNVNDIVKDDQLLPLRHQISTRTHESEKLNAKDSRLLRALDQLSQRATLRNDFDHSRNQFFFRVKKGV